MQTTTLSLTMAALGLCASTLVALPAHAHINMKGALKSRGGNEKSSPCDGKRGDGPVYTFAPGATITLAVNENIPHPSYFRIAFDNDGEDGFVEPKSIKPIDPSRKCPFNDKDQCGESDFCNVTSADGASVLWDNLDPHLSSGAKGGTWNIKLPDIECDNCTLQVLQVMEDTIHGAYCPTGSCEEDNPIEDIYHRCVDIKLVKGATDTTGVTTAPIANKGIDCLKDAKPAEPPTPAGDAGSSTAPDAGKPTTPAKADAGSTTTPRDAGTPSKGDEGEDDGETPDDEDEETDGTTSGSGAKKDAGTTVKKDAGKGTVSSSDDDKPASTGGDEGGCSVAPGSSAGMSGAVWSLLALGACLVRRKRSRAA